MFSFGQPGVDLHCHHDADVAVLQILFLVNEVRNIQEEMSKLLFSSPELKDQGELL